MSDPSTFHSTYEDYVRLTGDGESFEFIDGERFGNPQPTFWHQVVSGNLAFLLRLHVRGRKLGILIHPPVDVVLADDTVLQPDLAVLLDEPRDRIRMGCIFGPPDFVIEILSPSTASRDRREKLAVYARYGVREYWLVDPKRARIEVFVLESGGLVKKAEHDSGEARSLAVLPGFSASLADVFERPWLVPMSNPTAFHWTYEDYVRLTEGEEYFEFIEGRQFVEPTPSTWHQSALGYLLYRLGLYTREEKLGVVLHRPLDVIFADDTVLQPDIILTLNEHRDRIREAGIFGAPDFVVEVISPSTELRDRHVKLEVYSRYGVREYWLADPESQRIEVFVLESGHLVKKAEHDSGEARSLAVLPGFAATLADVFRRPWEDRKTGPSPIVASEE